MWKYLFLAAISLLTYETSAQETGIRFEECSFNEALEKARITGRYLFIDCYASWCVPCKQLEKEVFTDPSVARYFNDRFINLRVDVEKGEGPVLRKRFGVQPVPTLLFINADGKVEHKFIGSYPPAEFIKLSDRVFNDEKRYGVLERKYESGSRDLSFMSEYLNELLDQSEYARAKNMLADLLTVTPASQLCDDRFFPVLTHNFIAEFNSVFYRFLKDNRETLIKNIGHADYNKTMVSLYKRYIATWIFSGAGGEPGESARIDSARADISTLSLEDNPGLLILTDIAAARVRGDYDAFVSIIETKYNLIPAGDKYVIFIDSDFFSKSASPALCKRYLNVIQKFIAEQNNATYSERLSRIVNNLKNVTSNSN